MGKKKYKKKKGINTATKIIIGIILTIFLYAFVPTTIDLVKLWQIENELQTELETQEAIQEELQNDYENMDSQEMIEEMAREFLGLVYPYEKIIIPTQSDTEESE
jgi:cell division protein FtsB